MLPDFNGLPTEAVNTIFDQDHIFPSVAMFPDGRYLAVWGTFGMLGDPDEANARIYNSDGTPFGAPFNLVSGNVGMVFPKVAVLKDGGFVLTWVNEAANDDVNIQRFNASGAPVGGIVKVDTTDFVEHFISNVTATPDGGYIVSWLASDTPSPEFVYARAFNADGSPKGDDFAISPSQDIFFYAPEITTFPDGSFAVVWSADAPGGDIEVFLRRFNADGTPKGDAMPISGDAVELDINPDITPLSDGGFVVVWNTNSGAAFFQIHGDDGFPVTLPISIDDQADFADLPVIKALPGNNFVISWIETDATVTDSVVFQIFGPDGSELSDKTIVAVNDNPGFFGESDVAVLKDGKLAFIWEDFDSTDSFADIFTKIFVRDNFKPVLTKDKAFVNKDSSVVIDALANDSDPDGDALSIVSVAGLDNGVAVINADNTITFTPDAGFTGEESFIYTATDGYGGYTTQRINVIVNAVPVAKKDKAFTEEDTPVVIHALANDSDPDGDALSIVSVAGLDNGVAVINADNTITFTPDAGFTGEESFIYTITDGNGGFATQRINVDIDPANQAPDAVKDNYMAFSGQTLTLNLLGNDTDPDGDPLTILDVWKVDAGNSAVINPDGTVTFTIGDDYVGNDYFYYKVSDGNGGTDVTAVNVTVADPDVYLFGLPFNSDEFVMDGILPYGGQYNIVLFDEFDPDSLNIQNIIFGYDELTDLITDFVMIREDGPNKIVAVDTDGGADSFVDIATLIVPFDSGILVDEVAAEGLGLLKITETI